ncbi:conjugal transfer protein TrbE [Paramesorhizobium deserti]|uniref:Conjugal transfer protein TrbE n=1 Tax=Paramesorhizobium deserti TaxID=1494590 RepID=A0A135I1Y0_9HYPH|nr:conjugal transfer protein TrbE [Paramesorhizobium deserti]KXF79445.1 conjugal transfer protein TrbE [Paramesorhizobium deserti]
MLNLSEYRKKNAGLADFLPWAALIAPGIVLNKDGSFQRTARFRGPDLDSATPSELIGTTARLNGALRRLGSGWAIFVEAQRNPATEYPTSLFADSASALLDVERREQFEESGLLYESSYYLTFVWLPPAEESSRMEGWLYEGREHSGLDPWELLKGFIDRTGRVLHLVEGFMPEAAWLDDGETLTYLHSTISTKRHRVRVPETPMHLDALLADLPLAGGLEPRLGEFHLRTLTVIGFPTVTFPGILDDLNRLAFMYRWSTRAIMLDKTDATRLVTKIRRQWFAKRKSVAAILKEVLTNEQSVLLDSDAANKAADADAALQDLGSDQVGEAYVTATVTVWDADPRIADEKLRLAEKVIQSRDFTAIVETVNAIEAWMGSIPGHVYANVRQPPISTLNLAHMMPLSAVWAGPEMDEHLGAPPLFYARTDGATPFRFSLHVGDVGHTMIVGPTGAGKSVLLCLMALQFRRYERSQVFAFDFGGSIRAATLAMGGDWQDLGGALTGDTALLNTVSLQPLAGIHDTPERAWAADWLVDILAREGVEITPDVKEHLWTALTSLASTPVVERTISGLAALLQSNSLKQALRPYCIGGPYGHLLDAEMEWLGSASVQAFETEGLVGTGAAPAVLSYLFHRIESRFGGRPDLLIIDEGWRALDDGGFAVKIKEWLKTLRKKNVSVIFSSQSLADIEASPIAPVIVESCPTRIFLANERAVEPQIAAVYRQFGLNDRQIEIIARATPKRDYYCQSRRGNRLFELGLGSIALTLCAASDKTAHALIDALMKDGARPYFLEAWLEANGLRWAADLIPDLTNVTASATSTAGTTRPASANEDGPAWAGNDPAANDPSPEEEFPL